jgi:hypothetical protein
MNESNEKKAYADWRRREAFMVPMTKEGMQRADERWNEFKKGWEYGMKYAVFLTEEEHKQNKHIHKFYLFFADKLREMLK